MRLGESRTCVCLRETGSGYGPGWTVGRMDGRNGETVTAGLKRGCTGEEREESVRRGRTEGCESLGRCDGTTAHKSSA